MQRFELPDMTCGHCVRAVTSAVQALDPAARVLADLGAHVLQVDSAVPRAQLAQALQQAGYPEAGAPTVGSAASG
jgi:copper chaperone